MDKNKTKKNKRVSIITLGCAKNIVDSERLLGLLKKHKLRISYDLDNTDSIIINTCGFIKPAKAESIDTIMEAVGMKEQGLISEIVVAGCLSERYKKELTDQIPDVDAFFGIEQFEDILSFLSPDIKKINSAKREIITPRHFAYLKIAEGCDHKCSFCAIPFIKGGFRSVPQNELLKEAKYLVSKGAKEIDLIAQDTTYYGMDINGQRQITKLLNILANETNAEWFRLMYTYPTGFPLDLLDVIKENERICNYFDIPLQHISDNMLKAMRRGINRQRTLELLDKIRNSIPDVAVRSSFIVGFPSETDEDFHELYDFIENYELDRVGVFIYSHEENTYAFEYEDNIPEDIKLSRRDELMKLQSSISLKKNRAKIGTTLKVLIDDINEDGTYFGRTEHDAPEVDNGVIIDSTVELESGEFVDVKISDCSEYDLYGMAIV